MTAPSPQDFRWTPLPQDWHTHACTNAGSVLLESSLPNADEHRSLLFTQPLHILRADTPDQIPGLFAALEAALQAGRWAAGWIAYEAEAHFLRPRSGTLPAPLAIFGIYSDPLVFDHTAPCHAEPMEAPQPRPLDLALMPAIDTADYRRAIGKIGRWIAAGDTYQVNFTTRLESPCENSAEHIYEALRHQQPSSYAAILNLLPQQIVLSFSPELFFHADSQGNITTRPMKGTAPRGATPGEDDAIASSLQNDEKNRAEHVMIVDLLRNDLNRICRTGSVQVERLFGIERLATVHQMTTSIRGQLPPRTPWYDVFRALFPGGSITGAPKHHTSALIERVEATPRGVYTGAIGYLAPDRSASFNIAIRTAVLEDSRLTLGVGGGIVADSTADGEYQEALLKSAFVQQASVPFQIIETMRQEEDTIPLLEDHLRRLAQSAEALGFPCHRASITEHLRRLPRAVPSQRVRLLLHRDGHIDLSTSGAPAWPKEIRLVLSEQRVRASSPHLRHKTTFRPEYDAAHRKAADAGFTDTLFCNEEGELTETCIASLLLCMDGRWYTPPLRCGALPGIYRQRLLEAKQIEERSLTVADLRHAAYAALCNAVRGTGAVSSVQLPGGDRIHWRSPLELPMLRAW